jgi:WXG100 family type VII secretion target
VATTQAQAAVMRQTADKFDQVNQSMQVMLKNLLGELEGLRTQWQGAGGRSFEQVKIAWSEDQVLAETAQAIRTSGHQYTVTDTSAADRLGGHRGGGRQLPL